MGEIAEMMLDGTMDPETGEFNFDGEDGPGWPMTGAEAAAYKRASRRHGYRRIASLEEPAFKVSKKLRAKVEAFGTLTNHNAFHWQVRRDGKVVADWWPHKSKWRIGGQNAHGGPDQFVRALSERDAG